MKKIVVNIVALIVGMLVGVSLMYLIQGESFSLGSAIFTMLCAFAGAEAVIYLLTKRISKK